MLLRLCSMGKQPKHKQEQHSNAGKKSGSVRAVPAKIRQLLLKAAFKRIPKAYQVQPHSEEARDALRLEVRKFPTHKDVNRRSNLALTQIWCSADYSAPISLA
jgi:hypothetical protein